MKNIITSLLFFTSALLIFNSSYADNKTIMFATDANYPPFEFYDYTSGKLAGYDIDITNSYYNTTGSIIIPDIIKQPTTNNSLKGLTVGVQKGTTFEAYLHAEYGHQIKIKTYEELQTALLDLSIMDPSLRKLDAIIGDTPVIQHWLNLQSPDQYDIIRMVGYNESKRRRDSSAILSRL